MRKPKIKTKPEVIYISERIVKLLKPKNENQAQLINSICTNNITIANGCAGTGKTYISGSKAIDFLQAGVVKTIILTRPYVPAGEKLGFIPGTIEEKFAPYLEPYLDCFIDRIGKQQVTAMLTDGRIQAKPISFIQGKTFNDAIILVDEAENATKDQLKLILTRMGENCKCVIMGDQAQTYIPNSGFNETIKILHNVPRLKTINFTVADVVRSDTCRYVLEAYEKYDENSRFYAEIRRENR